MDAAAPSKTTTCIGKFNAKLQASPWYDSECQAQRQTYNRLRNKYNKSKTDNDKDSRDEAKKVYMFACVNQSRQLMIKKKRIFFWSAKFTDSRKYWQHIKPRTSQCDTKITPALFAEHFQNYIPQNTSCGTCLERMCMMCETTYLIDNFPYMRWNAQLRI